jgi:site-specific DNA-methyltransferase (adenine-specific)
MKKELFEYSQYHAPNDIHLWNGECLELLDLFIAEGHPKVDMILCDLPYGTTACKWDAVIPFDELWKRYEQLIKDGGAIVLFSTQPFTTELIHSKIDWFKYAYVWDKKQSGSFWLAKYQPLRITEDVLVFSKGGKKTKYYPQMREGKMRTKGGAKNPVRIVAGGLETTPKTQSDKYFPTNILDFSNAGNKGTLHPTQKPIDLLKYLIETYTGKGEVVLDNCMGVGSTAIASAMTGRGCIGIELEKEFYDKAVVRFNLLHFCKK